MSFYKNAVCRGAWALGTACGICERCEEMTALQRVENGRRRRNEQRLAAAADPWGHAETLRWHWLRRKSDGALRIAWHQSGDWRISDLIARTTWRTDKQTRDHYDYVCPVQLPEA